MWVDVYHGAEDDGEDVCEAKVKKHYFDQRPIFVVFIIGNEFDLD